MDNVIHHIMVVDDDDSVLKALRRELENCGRYCIKTFNSPETALAHAETQRMDLLITDYKMPCMHGLTFLKRVTTLQPHIAVIVISGNAEEALRHSQFNDVQLPTLLSKPWPRHELLWFNITHLKRAIQPQSSHRTRRKESYPDAEGQGGGLQR